MTVHADGGGKKPAAMEPIIGIDKVMIAMRGELTVESTVGKGTCFRVRLPTD